MCLRWERSGLGLLPIRQHLRAVKVHDPVRVRVILFREFGFRPFGDEVS